MRRQGRQQVLGYLIAVVATAALALMRRFVLADLVGADALLYLFLVIVAAAAWCGGVKAGLLATALSAWAGMYFFPAPDGEPARLSLFLISGAAISCFFEKMHHNQARAAQQRESLRITLACMGDAVITTDDEGRVTSLNAVAAELTGWTQDQAEGRPLEEVFRIINEQTRQVVLNPVKRVLAEGRIVGLANHTLLIAKDGTERPIDDSAAPIQDAEGTIRGVVLIFRDISEQKQLQRQLQEADRRKDEFLAILAHELRNPLAPIRNALQVLRLAGDNKAAIEQARPVIERQLQQMVRLVDDLMDVSRVARNKVQLRKDRIELARVVRHALETSRPLIEEAGQELTVTLPDKPIHVDADESRLAQVFANLLNNSAKYTERGGRIALTVELASGGCQSADEVIVRVKDSGVGIPADQLPFIFEMFAQVDQSLERSQGGLGIGLTLVKRLTEMHGGTVEVHSEGANKGSEFIVHLPVAGEPPAQQPSSAAECANPAVARPCKVLIVDDSEDTAASMRTILHMMGHDARIAHDGAQAVEIAGSYLPDVVLLDISLPKLNGYEVARHIRQQPWGRTMKLVALTGWGHEADKRRSKETGLDYHITKPVEPADLEVLLRKLCSAPA